MRFFITGGQGFVGRYLCSHLLSSPGNKILAVGRSPVSLDNFTHHITVGGRRILAPLAPSLRTDDAIGHYTYATVDVRNAVVTAKLLRAFQPDVVVHLASGLRDDPVEDLFATNVLGTIQVIEAIAQSSVQIKVLILGSSGGVYGIPEHVPIEESAVCRPVDLYSASKLAAEHTARIMCVHRQIPIITARLFNLIGPGQDERHVCGQLAAQAAAIIAREAEPVIEIGDLSPTRDFVDVRDVAEAISLLSQCGTPGEVYNVGSGRETPIRLIFDLTLRLAGLEGRVTVAQKPARASDISRHVADISRLQRLGYAPALSLDRSVGDLLRYYADAS